MTERKDFLTDRPLMNWGHREMIGLGAPDASSFIAIRRLAESGRLTPAQGAPYADRVAEELYHLAEDPDEVVNLAEDPRYRERLMTLRAALAEWIEETGDKGQYPRSSGAMKEVIDRFPKSWLRSPEFDNLDASHQPKLGAS